MNEEFPRHKATKAHRQKAVAKILKQWANRHMLVDHLVENTVILHKWDCHDERRRTKFHVKDVPALSCQPWLRAN